MTEILNNTLVVHIAKEVDHHNASIIREEVEYVFKKNNLKNIIFDFSKVNFIDSSGIGMCIGRYKLAKSIGGDFAACSLTSETCRIFDMAGLSKLIKIYDDVNSALENLS
ncbi:MAG: anti-sigma factor antagonist [Lachnospirales bacterium]